MDGLIYLGLAYIVLWVGVCGFLFSVARRQRALEQRIEELSPAEKGPVSK